MILKVKIWIFLGTCLVLWGKIIKLKHFCIRMNEWMNSTFLLRKLAWKVCQSDRQSDKSKSVNIWPTHRQSLMKKYNNILRSGPFDHIATSFYIIEIYCSELWTSSNFYTWPIHATQHMRKCSEHNAKQWLSWALKHGTRSCYNSDILSAWSRAAKHFAKY